MAADFVFARSATLSLIALLAATAVSSAAALDVPKRKSGLWEIKTSMAGMPAGMGTIQTCVDERTDDITQQQAQAQNKKMCSQNEVKREGDRTLIHSVCTFDKTKATTDGVFTGQFDSHYRGEFRTQYDPPMMGVKEHQMTIEAKWLGACKAGQKPGDVMVNGMTLNPATMRGQKPH